MELTSPMKLLKNFILFILSSKLMDKFVIFNFVFSFSPFKLTNRFNELLILAIVTIKLFHSFSLIFFIGSFFRSLIIKSPGSFKSILNCCLFEKNN